MSGQLVTLMVPLVMLYSTATACLQPCADPAISKFPFCNPELTVYDRVTDLLGRLTPEEKVSQLGNTAPAIDRLKIPSYQWWSEANHGVAHSPGVSFTGKIKSATSFPQVIGLAATFNTSLIQEIGGVIATEARAMNNIGQCGLTLFAPELNIYRDPRWGRGQETPGEDPFLSAQYATHFVQGLQEGNDIRYLKTAGCCKAFAAYDLENWNGTDRHHFNAIISDQDLIETYFPIYEACVRESNVASIMCSYNAVNGVPSCANDLFLNKVARDQWGFEGFIVSDCGAVGGIMTVHQYTKTPADTVQVALRGGTDLNCGSFYQKNGMDAYKQKKISDDDLNLALGRLFGFRMKLGMFDPPASQPYCQIGSEEVNAPAHQALALDAARESIVLLKNDGALPLDMKKKVALIGPNSNATNTMQGNYQGTAPFLISPLQGMKDMNISVTQIEGCDVSCTSDSGFSVAVTAAKSADVVVAVIGLDQGQEKEGHDRTQLTLPGMQEKLLDEIKKGIASSTPLIVVLMSGGSVDITWAKNNANAVLWVGYPGQSGGQAIADVLFGAFNPSGRLPMTFYPADYVNQISFFNMSMRANPGRSYKFYNGKAVYEFGEGYSYTTFNYKWSAVEGNALTEREPLVLSRQRLRIQDGVNYSVEVTNSGKLAGGVSVLEFLTSSVPGAPLKRLIGFQKLFLQPGETKEVFFGLSPDIFMLVNEKGHKELCPGYYQVRIGNLKHLVTLL